MSTPIHGALSGGRQAAVAAYITAPRLAPFLATAGGNQRRAVQLYHWNINLSGAVYESLHVFEVVLRNAMDAELCKWNCTQTNARTGVLHGSDWLLDPSRLLLRLTRNGDDIAKGRERAKQATRHRSHAMGHPDVLAQMSFGTWRFLLPTRKDPGRQRLWSDALIHAFPRLARSEFDVTDDVAGIHALRNRVAHLEPLLRTSDVRKQYESMRRVLSDINPDVEQWFTSIQRITPVLKNRP